MKTPRHYLETIQQNVEKMRAQGQVTPTENALFGMVDGLAGLTLQTMERVAYCEQRIRDLEAAAGITPAPPIAGQQLGANGGTRPTAQ